LKQATSYSSRTVLLEFHSSIAVLRFNDLESGVILHSDSLSLADALIKAGDQGIAAAIVFVEGCASTESKNPRVNAPLSSAEVIEYINAIKACRFPVVAALEGEILDEALELALACDYRIAESGAIMGISAVSFGVVPGAGGTQRLPRLIGVSRSIELIATSKLIQAQYAMEIGLIDQVVSDEDLPAMVLDFLKDGSLRKRRILDSQSASEAPEVIERIQAQALKRGKHRDSVVEAIRLIKASATTAIADAIADERATFQRLRQQPDAIALNYLFLAERLAGTVDGVDDQTALSVSKVGVVGGGTMGQGIAKALLASGYYVTLIEQSSESKDNAIKAISTSYDALIEKGRMNDAEASERLRKLVGSCDINLLAECQLIIEAVFEDMRVKQQLLANLESLVSEQTILATNTSYLDIDQMVSALKRPERVLGLHFFSPADVMKLLEVIKTDRTSDSALATGLAIGRKLGKRIVVSKVAEGFIGNRIYAAYRRRAELLVLDGALPEQVDTAIREFGFAMGPFEVGDLSGLDIAWAMRKQKAASRDPNARYVDIPDRLCEMGRLGRKTKMGWYSYLSGKRMPDPQVVKIIETSRAENNISPTHYEADAIQRQLMAAIVNEATCLLEDGIAQRPSDIDVTLTNGYGFPRWRGGPLYWAKGQNEAQLDNELKILSSAIGVGHRRGDVISLLSKLTTIPPDK
jgi:3-hydroxyacyl-CoA dehydrogenase